MDDRTPADGSVTRELREWGDARFVSRDNRDAIERIAGRIDMACMEKAEQRGRDEYDDGFANADSCWADQDDETLAEHGMVRLPVDADGEPWHVGDVAAKDLGRKMLGGTITNMELGEQGWSIVLDNYEVCRCPSMYGHRKPTPAERIRSAVQVLTDEGGADGPALKSLMDIADELEGDE